MVVRVGVGVDIPVIVDLPVIMDSQSPFVQLVVVPNPRRDEPSGQQDC
jgi:hypothetical protein